MTKKHFEIIAAQFKSTMNALDVAEGEKTAQAARSALKYTAENLATEFAKINPNFDRARFLKAAGF